MAWIFRLIFVASATALCWFLEDMVDISTINLLNKCWAWEQWEIISPFPASQWLNIISFLSLCALAVLIIKRCIWQGMGIIIGLLGLAVQSHGFLYVLVCAASIIVFMSLAEKDIFYQLILGAFPSFGLSIGFLLGMATGLTASLFLAALSAISFFLIVATSNCLIFLTGMVASIPDFLDEIELGNIRSKLQSFTIRAIRSFRIF
jgi:hypothetical protein